MSEATLTQQPRRPRRRFRFSLRTALALLLLAQIPLIYVAHLRACVVRERQALNYLIGSTGGKYWRDIAIVDEEGTFHPQKPSWGQKQMQRWGIEEYFYPVTTIGIQGREFDARLQQALADLPRLQIVGFLACTFTHETAFPTNGMTNLQAVGFQGSDIPLPLFESLSTHHKIRSFSLNDCQLPSPGLARIGELQNLRQLMLIDLAESCEDWTFLQKLPRLTGLQIERLPNATLDVAALPPSLLQLNVVATSFGPQSMAAVPRRLSLDSIVVRESDLSLEQFIGLVMHSPKLALACFTEMGLSDDDKLLIKRRFPRVRFQL